MDKCEWLHKQLEELPLVQYPFNLEDLPNNGIYFFYEDGENWGHGGINPRIVRVGTHKNNNFRSRINDHFLIKGTKMNFNQMKPAPRDRSIFRRNIGRALLNKEKDDYLDVWNIGFTKRNSREEFGHLRDISKEKKIETEVTKILREKFSFRFIIVDNQLERMGSSGLESSLIGTLAQCEVCKPSNTWLGSYSPKQEIKEKGLWLVQHLNNDAITENEKMDILKIKNNTMERNIWR